MIKEERDQIMVDRKGWNRSVFENKSDEEVERDYFKVLEESE